jgi:hypothetical protein
MPGFRIGRQGSGNLNDQNSLDASLQGKDIKRTHRWRILKFGSIGGQPILTSDDLLFAKSITMPSISFSEESVLGGSIPYKFATKPEFSDLEIAFYDLEGLEPKIRKWQSLVWSKEKGVGMANDYKDEVILYLTNGAGKQVDDSWKFVNAWPKTINHGALVYDNSDFKLVTITISFDWIEYPEGKQSSAGAVGTSAAATQSVAAAAAQADPVTQSVYRQIFR